MKLSRWAVCAAAIALALAPGASAACINVGVYQDDPGTSLRPLERGVGPGIGTISIYLTAGRPLNPGVIALANRERLQLLVSWLPDGGRDGPKQQAYRVSAVRKGKFDASLRALARQLAGATRPVIFRPMPEMNTPWYAWSGTVNGNTAKDYVAAWKHVRQVVRRAGGKRIKFLWTPYARSIPDTGANAIGAYFPGRSEVDLVGAVAFNFGDRAGLGWTDPAGLFAPAYATIEALAPKPFWIAETGSTALGGDKAAWIRSLGALRTSMPKLNGIVWFDVQEPNGDFRIAASGATRTAFKELLRRSCR